MCHPRCTRDKRDHKGRRGGIATTEPMGEPRVPPQGMARVEAAAPAGVSPKPATARRNVSPFLPVVFGLGEIEAAAAIGISASKFRSLVKDGRMPWPRRLDGRNIWDVDELRAAFKTLPHKGEDEKADSWADVV